MDRLAIILLLLVPYFLGAQTTTWEHYRNSLEINDAIVHQNKLWIATDNGLYNMDRTTLQVEHYSTQNSSLPDMHIQTLTKDAVGNLWIGTYDLALVQIPATGGNWDVINYPTNPSFTNIYCTEIDGNGDVWLGTNNGLMHYDGNTWQTYAMNPSHAPVWDMKITSTGKVFIGSFNFQSFDNGVWTELVDSTQPHAILTYADHDLYLENDSTVWLLPVGINKILRYQNGNWLEWSTNNGTLPIAPKFENAELRLNEAGQLSYNTNSNKLVYYDGANWQVDSSIQYQFPLFYSGAGFQKFLNDDNGNLWAFDQNKVIQKTSSSTITHQLTELKKFGGYENLIPDNLGNMFMLSPYHSIPSQKIENGVWSDFAVITATDTIKTFNHGVFDANNRLWATTRKGTYGNYSSSILEQTATGWIEHNHSTTAGQLPQFVQQGGQTWQFSTVLIGATGTVWVQYGPNYIFEYKNGAWAVLHAAPSNVYINQLQVDNMDNLWWLEYNSNYQYQLKKFDGVNLHSLSTPPPSSTSGMYRIHADNNGNLWLANASLNTLEKFDGAGWSTITIPSGLNSGNLYPSKITSNNGKLYVATNFGGLFDYDGTSWNNTTINNSNLYIDVISNVTFDSNGDLWIEDYYNKLLDIWNLGSSVTTAVTTINNLEKLELVVYPNPTANILNITHPKEAVENISILDAKGQVVKIVEATQSTTTQISVEQLAAGTYWIKLNSTKKQYIQPFIKH